MLGPLVLVLASLAPVLPPRQAPPEEAVAAYADEVRALLEEAVARGEAYAMLADLCRTAPHRLSGSEGAATAVAWARRRMEAIGLERVRLEPCTVPRWVRGDVERLTLAAPEEVAGEELRILALGGSVPTPEGGVEGPLVAVRSFRELEELGPRAEGAVVLFDGPMSPELLDPFAAYGLAVRQRVEGASRAARVGASAVIVRSMTTRLDDSPHTGALRYAPEVGRRIPAAAVSTLGAERLRALLDAGEEVVVRLELDCRTLEDVESFNVVGELRGREAPDEIVLVGGHLDGWDVGQGAHDDGAGTCHALEVPRLLQALDLRPRRTIRVVLFMNEENGLRGAHAYREAHRDELDRHVLALESDRGGFTPRGFTCDGDPEALRVVRAIAELLEEAGASRVLPGGGGADVAPLARDGVITMGYLPDAQRYFDVHHSENDVLEAVSPRELNLGAGVIAAMCYVVADLPEPLPRSAPGSTR